MVGQLNQLLSDMNNPPEVRLTTGGSSCIIISRNAGGDKPILGAYWTGDEWLPCKWDVNGRFLSDEHPRKLDIDIEVDERSLA